MYNFEQEARQATQAVNLPELWWRELDYLEEFGQGGDGFFPRTGQVIKHYRRRAMDKDGKPTASF